MTDEEALRVIYALAVEEDSCSEDRQASTSRVRNAWPGTSGAGTWWSPCCATHGTRYASKIFNPAFLTERDLPSRRGWKEERDVPDHTSASPLVSAEWLRDAFERPDVVVLDASWHMPATRRDGASEFELGHIPGAAFFSIDGIADPDSTLPHMVPTAEAFAAAVGALGVGAGDHVVCYATEGIGTAPRAWWMFRLFGHERVSVLDGGLPAWTASGGTLVKGPARPRPRAFPGHVQTRRGSGTWKPSAPTLRRRPSWWSTPGAPAGLPAPRRNRGPGFEAAISPEA